MQKGTYYSDIDYTSHADSPYHTSKASIRRHSIFPVSHYNKRRKHTLIRYESI